MSINPLQADPARDAAIKTKARELWQSEGAPDGGPDAYMDRATDLVGMEESGPTGLENVSDLPPPELADVQVEDAAIQENLGEAPLIGADQGEKRETPVATRKEANRLDHDPVAEHGTPGQAHPDA